MLERSSSRAFYTNFVASVSIKKNNSNDFLLKSFLFQIMGSCLAKRKQWRRDVITRRVKEVEEKVKSNDRVVRQIRYNMFDLRRQLEERLDLSLGPIRIKGPRRNTK